MSAEKIRSLVLLHKITLILILAVVLVLAGGVVAYQKIANKNAVAADVPEVDLSFDPEGAYAILSPRRDGNALVLDLKRTASYDSISYELAYTSLPDNSASGNSGDSPVASDSGKIERGVMGTINTNDKKGEYIQEILFGTCSKNICQYDRGVEDGTLTLHLRKGNQAYRMITEWHLQQPDVALGSLSSGDGHFQYQVTGADNNQTQLSLVKYTIINDLSGSPKLPTNKTVVGKVYALNTPMIKELPGGKVTIELADNPPAGSKIAVFDDVGNLWNELDTQISGSTLSANVQTGGVFAVLAPKQ